MEHWFDVALTIIVSIVGWFAIRLWNRMDKAEDRQNAMQLQCVTRPDLDNRLAEMKADRLRMHEDNKTSLGKIEDSVKSIDDTVRNVALQVASLVPNRRSRN